MEWGPPDLDQCSSVLLPKRKGLSWESQIK